MVASAASRAVVAAARERAGPPVAGAQALLEGVGRRHERVQQGLVADVGLAALLDALDGRPEHRHGLVAADRLGAADRAARPQERRAPDRARGTADAAGDDHRDLPEEGRRVACGPDRPTRPARSRSPAPASSRSRRRPRPSRGRRNSVSLSTAVWAIVRTTSSTCSKPACAIRPPPGCARSFVRQPSRQASRSRSVTQSPGSARHAVRRARGVRSPSGSPSELTTSTASRKSSSAV